MHRAARIRLIAPAVCALAGCSVDYDRYLASDGGRIDLGAPRDAAMDLAAPDASTDDASDGDAGLDASADADDEDTSTRDAGCVPRHPPVRPDVADGEDVPPRYYGIRSIRVGEDGAWRDLGYDFDGLCTTVDSAPTDRGCMPIMEEAGFGPPTDAEGGVDNSYGQSFIPLLVLLYPTFEDELNAAFSDGRVGVLLRVAGWNGTPDDPVVDIAVVEGVELEHDPGVDPAPPRWDGFDRWIVADRAFAAGDLSRPLARDTAGYVTGGTLVARPRDGTEVHLRAGVAQDLTIRLDGVIVTGRLNAFGDVIEAGIIAGRWPLDDIYGALPGLGLCPDTELYPTTMTALQRYADVIGSGDVSPVRPCDALSLGFGMTASLVEVAGVGPARPRNESCGRDAGTAGGG